MFLHGAFKDDVSKTLPERARCGVSLDLPRSASILESTTVHSTPTAQLSQLYSWLGRLQGNFESSLVYERCESWCPSSAQSCGPLTAFLSPHRQTALQMCGWSDLCNPKVDTDTAAEHKTLSELSKHIPLEVVQRALSEGDVERAAAISLLHGLVEVSVQILTLAADEARRPSGGQPGTLHAELLQLTAMAIAGCPGPATSILPSSREPVDLFESNRRVWLKSCRSLNSRVDGARHPYLKVCHSEHMPIQRIHVRRVLSRTSRSYSQSFSKWLTLYLSHSRGHPLILVRGFTTRTLPHLCKYCISPFVRTSVAISAQRAQD
jgi:hypothetical protein